jgi:hypothetical protein
MNIERVTTLTQLQSLSLYELISSSFSCATLSALTGLTSLTVTWPQPLIIPQGNSNEQQQQQEMRQQGQGLQFAISHMEHLKELSFTNILVSASIATALAQLTGLTRLRMYSTEPDDSWYVGACYNPVVLPLVNLALTGQGALQFLAGTHLPQLASLDLAIRLSQGTKQAHLLQEKAGLLQVCDGFGLTGQGKEVAVDELEPMLATLASAWQQPPPTGHRKLHLNLLSCPRATTSHLPLGMTGLGFQ